MLSLPHRLGWQSTVGYLVKPGNTCRIFGDAGVRVSPLFRLRHCFPFVGQLTLLEQYDTVLLGRQRTDVYLTCPRKQVQFHIKPECRLHVYFHIPLWLTKTYLKAGMD